MSELLHELLLNTARQFPGRVAVIHKEQQWRYQELAELIANFAQLLLQHQLSANGRVAVYLPKQIETLAALFGSCYAGGVMVPVNPQLKAPQVSHIVSDSGAEFLVTTKHRYSQCKNLLNQCPTLRAVILIDDPDNSLTTKQEPQASHDYISHSCISWAFDNKSSVSDNAESRFQPHRRISHDIAALLYTSGSTGLPKGVILSHLNMVAGAKSVAGYLHNHKDDRLLAVLPFSFDYGFSQLTTAFLTGASVVLLEHLMPRDVIRAVEKYRITGLAAVPPLWIQLAQLDWGETDSLRYITNSGGVMPRPTLAALREKLPQTSPYLMYGLTEAFRSTYLDPKHLDSRPTSMGKAIPDAEILVLNEQGEQCRANEPGELVHRGVHVAQGYWNAPDKTAQRFRPLPKTSGGRHEEIVVWSGDTVTRDEQGFLYFVGRQDDMIKSSGYRISPAELEALVIDMPQVAEVAAFGVPHEQLGQAIVLAVKLNNNSDTTSAEILKLCKQQLPNYMHPHHIEQYDELPKNPNGKIDRVKLTQQQDQLFSR
jgi:acyl-CoA ligase (AMP-forming) (exosortase A-associated)